MNTFLDADQSAELLTAKIRAREPFFFLRYGDGALECMDGKRGVTCDGEHYSMQLGLALYNAWLDVCRAGGVYLGDWLSASFRSASDPARYAVEYSRLVAWARPVRWLHFEALLLMRESEALLDFYRAVKSDGRRKLFMGPEDAAGAAEMLGAEHLVTPMGNPGVGLRDLAAREFDVLLYGAGLAANVAVVHAWRAWPKRTYIHLGSALDPLFRGRTRQQQIPPVLAREFFKELLTREAVHISA